MKDMLVQVNRPRVADKIRELFGDDYFFTHSDVTQNQFSMSFTL